MDFTVPEPLGIRVGAYALAVPVATLSKRPLKRLDVRDASGCALSIWGRDQNGALAAEVLRAGLETIRPEPLTPAMRTAVNQIVFAGNRSDVADQLDLLFSDLESSPLGHDRTADLVEAVRGLAETLADGFLLVVELPTTALGKRTTVKVSYDDDRLPAGRLREALIGRASIRIETRGWGEARSWHLEVHAPDALNIQQLAYEVWDDHTLELASSGSDGGQASTAHITGAAVLPGYDFEARLRLSPARPGLTNQVPLGVSFGLLLLIAGVLAAEGIAERLAMPGRGAPIVAVAFSIPAFLLALLARGHEHHLVSRVLMGPRLVSFAGALTLWATGLLLAWTTSADSIARGMGALATVQAVLLVWAEMIRPVGEQG